MPAMHAMPSGRSVARMNSPSCDRSRGSRVACELQAVVQHHGEHAGEPDRKNGAERVLVAHDHHLGPAAARRGTARRSVRGRDYTPIGPRARPVSARAAAALVTAAALGRRTWDKMRQSSTMPGRASRDAETRMRPGVLHAEPVHPHRSPPVHRDAGARRLPRSRRAGPSPRSWPARRPRPRGRSTRTSSRSTPTTT